MDCFSVDNFRLRQLKIGGEAFFYLPIFLLIINATTRLDMYYLDCHSSVSFYHVRSSRSSPSSPSRCTKLGGEISINFGDVTK